MAVRRPPRGKSSSRTPSPTLSTDPDSADLENDVHWLQDPPAAPKYKTELCHNFSERGSCPYRDKCQFAHGPQELQPCLHPATKKFRTKRCKSFWSLHFCPYGPRCQFSHEQAALRETRTYLGIWRAVLQEGGK